MDFYQHKDIQKIFKVLNGRSRASQIMIVGGAVRDYSLGLRVSDIDMATLYNPEIVIDKLSPFFKMIPTGMAHGTVTALTGFGAVQITSLRRDEKTDGRYAEIEYTDDWVEDARRRDFTINTLLMDATGKIFDPLGLGLDDLKAQKVRFVGNAEERIVEDYLRILRYIRFQARFGRGVMPASMLKIFKEYKVGLKRLSIERVTDEISKIIFLTDGFKILSSCIHGGLLSFPKIDPVFIKFHKKIILKNFMTAPLAFALFSSFKKSNWNRLKKNLRLSNKIIDSVDCLLECWAIRDKKSLDYQLYRFGTDTVRQIYLLWMLEKNYSAQRVEKELIALDQLVVPVFPLSGGDLIKAGYKQGAALGAELLRLEKKWVRSGFKFVPSVSAPRLT